jgi:hypothetical protein
MLKWVLDSCCRGDNVDKKRWKQAIGLSMFLLLFSAVIGASQTKQVEHAPTVEQCRADQALWLSKLETTPRGSGTSNVDVRTLHAWAVEMDDCKAVDQANELKYYNTEAETTAAVSGRELGFIYRHNLYQQFLDEDAAGKR